jgi:hypothetical protein
MSVHVSTVLLAIIALGVGSACTPIPRSSLPLPRVR